MTLPASSPFSRSSPSAERSPSRWTATRSRGAAGAGRRCRALRGTGSALARGRALVQWSSRRHGWFRILFDIGSLTLASLAAWGVSVAASDSGGSAPVAVALGLAAGSVYFLVVAGLAAVVLGARPGERLRRVWKDRYLRLLPHYAAFGAVGAAIAVAYGTIGVWAFVVLVLPLLLVRRTIGGYVRRTEVSAGRLRTANETMRSQNASLELANRLLRERSTEMMETLAATQDARDALAQGHSARVERIALAIGELLDLSAPELEVLGYAARFHDIGKLVVPDAVLLKASPLYGAEWALMRTHAEEGARIIERLGFLQDRVPLIRHHHEHYDGSGYPDNLVGADIPLGARIIHIADALDTMTTARTLPGPAHARAGDRGASRGRRTSALPALRPALLRVPGLAP